MSGPTKKSQRTAEVRNLRDHHFRHQRGNKCMKCGYSRSPRALHWHHVHPEEKSFQLSKRTMDFSMEVLQKEINKCVLLCGNCHMELHDGYWDLTEGEKRAYKETTHELGE